MILYSRQFQEDFCFDSCKEATTCGAVFLKVATTLYDVGDVTKPSTSLAPVILWQRMLPSQAPWLQILKRPATGCAMMGKADINFIQAYCKGGLFFIQAYSRGTHCFNNFIQANSRGGLWCNKHQQLEPFTGSLHPRLQQYEQQQRKPRSLIFKLQIHGKASPSKEDLNVLKERGHSFGWFVKLRLDDIDSCKVFKLRSDDIDCCKVLSRSRHQWILGTLQTIQRIQTPPSDGPIMLAITSEIVVVVVFVVQQSWQYQLIW